MELGINLGLAAWLVLIVSAGIFGALMQQIGETRSSLEWVVDAVAFGIGALVASEFIVAWQTFEPVFDNLALVPALIGGVVVGLLTDAATRYVTGGHYTQGAMSA